MRIQRRKLAIAGLGCALVMGLALFRVFATKEATYKGRTISDWVTEADGPEKQAAVVALGTNDLPRLVHQLAYDPFADSLLALSGRLPRGVLQDVPGYFVAGRLVRAQNAEMLLLVLGPQAAPAIPELEKVVARGGYFPGDRALRVLDAIGPEGLGVIVSIASQTNHPMRLSAMNQLTAHTNFPSARTVLTNALADPDPIVRRMAASVLSGNRFE